MLAETLGTFGDTGDDSAGDRPDLDLRRDEYEKVTTVVSCVHSWFEAVLERSSVWPCDMSDCRRREDGGNVVGVADELGWLV